MAKLLNIILVLCTLTLEVYSIGVATGNDTSVEYDYVEESRERFLFGGVFLKKCKSAVEKVSNVLPTLPVTLTRLSNNKLYFFAPTASVLTFDQAVQYCKDHGMHLVTINNEAENVLVYNKGVALGSILNPPAVWIGHRDITGSNVYEAIQPHVGPTPTFFGVAPVVGRCAAYRDLAPPATPRGAALSWVTRPCNIARAFICEMEPPCGLLL